MSTFIKKNSYSILFLVIAWVLAFLYIQLSTDTVSFENYKTVTISSGDTLWEIAADYQVVSNHTIGEFISWVEKHNEMNGNDIKPGDVIVIPVEYETDLQYLASSGE